MQTKKITFEHLKELVSHVNNYLGEMGKKKNLLSVKMEKVSPSLKKALQEYSSMVEDLRADHCSVDAEGNMIIKEGVKGEDRFTFKPDKMKALRVEIRKLEEKEVSVDVNIAGSVPKDLGYAESKYFRGILIPEDYIYEEPKEEIAAE